jgi:hypothetical protein
MAKTGGIRNRSTDAKRTIRVGWVAAQRFFPVQWKNSSGKGAQGGKFQKPFSGQHVQTI